jgi:hypothetical protein
MSGLFGGGGSPSLSNTQPAQVGILIQTSAYGMALPIVYGRNRVPGNLIWYGAFTAIPHTTTSSAGGGGGKGGGGAVSQTNTSYTYTASLMLGIAEGEIQGVGSVWADKTFHATNDLFTIFDGSQSQGEWGYLSSTFPDQAVAYSRIAYAAAANYDLGTGTSLPNHTFEVSGILGEPISTTSLVDANPSDILVDYLTNPIYGAGFPASKLGNWSQYWNYCQANGFLFSPVYDSQKPAHDAVTQMMLLTNSGVYYSEGLLKIVPFGDSVVTGNGATFTPNITPIYDLTDDDYDSSATDPIIITRIAPADAYNQIQIEHVNRGNQYNVEVAEAKDQTSIDMYGLRTQSPISAHEITLPEVGRSIAQLLLQRAVYIRNQYEFKLGIRFCLLEPTDYVTLTDSALGLNQVPVRILSIEEDSSDLFTVIAEDAPAGVSNHALYQTPSGASSSNNFNKTPGYTNNPTIFEPPDTLANGLAVWVGASGGDDWGGCQVWVSNDGSSYQQIAVIRTKSRDGVLTAILPSGSDPDTTHTLSVDLSQSNGQLLSASQLDVDTFNTLAYVDGELIAYRDATLTAANKYNLSYLRRGVYGTTIGAHAVGTQFARVDGSMAQIPYDASRIGQNLYIKLPAFNIYGGGLQTLADVSPYTYKITGWALFSPLPNVQNIVSNFNNFVGGLTTIYWDAVSDFRNPIDYEIRQGSSWETGKVIGRTAVTRSVVPSSGQYWIAAHYAQNGIDTYSGLPSPVYIATASLQNNIVDTFDERSSGWTGSKTNLVVNSGSLELTSSSGLVTSANGTYELPSAHAVNIGRVAPCNVLMDFVINGVPVNENILTSADVFGISDLLDSALGTNINIVPQIAIADSSGVYGAWQNFTPGYYNAQYFKARFLVSTSDLTINAVIQDFVFSVDVPDRQDSGTITTLTAGSTISYVDPFNGGANGSAVPAVQITIVNAQLGDTYVLSNQTATGFTVRVIDSTGTGVARTVNWSSKGY